MDSLEAYNSFCKNLKEGSILYNLNNTNSWGEYLMVANKTAFILNGMKTYTVLLIGLSKKTSGFSPRRIRVSLTPDNPDYIHFLKYIGYCKFNLMPTFDEVNVNTGLIAVYGSADLHKYANKINIRKPQRRKYDADGKPIIKSTNI